MRTLLTLILCLSFALSALAASPAETAYAQGRAAIQRGEFDKAAELLERAVELNPRNAEYHYHLGTVYGMLAQNANMFKQASLAKKTKAEFEKAVELDPNALEPRFGLIDYYLIAPAIMGGSEEKAHQQANEIRKRDKLMGHRAWARIHMRAKKPDLARKEYTDAVRELPTDPKSHYALGVFYMTADKNYPAAMQAFETTVKVDPTHMPGWFQIGHVAALAGTNLGRGEEAIRKYLAYKPVDDEPSLARAWYWLGGIQEKQGKKAEAKQSYQTSLRLTPGAKDVTEALKRVS